MTWEPRNRVEDDDDNNNEDDDDRDEKAKDNLDSKDSGTASSEDGDRPMHARPAGDTGSEWSESRADSGPDSPELLGERELRDRPPYPHPLHPAYHGLPFPPGRLPPPPTTPPSSTTTPGASTPGKPRIWSLADMASKDSDHPHHPHHGPPPGHPGFYPSPGKLISPLASRGVGPVGPVGLPHPHLHPAAAAMHAGSFAARAAQQEFYRSFYGSAAGHPSSAALLETYSRTFGAAGVPANGAPPPPGMNPALSSVLSKAGMAAVAAAVSGVDSNPLNGLASQQASVNPGASSSSSASSGSSLASDTMQAKLAGSSPVPLSKA